MRLGDSSSIYSATCSLPASQAMNFFTTNVKEMGIPQVVAVKLYQCIKLWRAQAEKMVIAEDLSSAAAADVITTELIDNVIDDAPMTVNSDN